MAIGEFGGAPAVPGGSGLVMATPLYWFYEMSHAALNPSRAMADATRLFFKNPINPLSFTTYGKSIAAACELFEPHGGLAFERHVACEAEERRSRIEEPAYRGGGECAYAFTNQLQRLLISLRERERFRVEVGKILVSLCGSLCTGCTVRHTGTS